MMKNDSFDRQVRLVLSVSVQEVALEKAVDSKSGSSFHSTFVIKLKEFGHSNETIHLILISILDCYYIQPVVPANFVLPVDS